MDSKMIAEIKKHMEQKTTNELQSIWIKNDREGWSNGTFEAVKQILTEQGIELLPQNPPKGANTEASPKAANCPNCGSDRIKKRFFSGSKAGAIACFILGGFIAFEELSRPGGDPLVLLLTAVFVLAGIAAITGKRYKCLDCKKPFDSDLTVDLPVRGELSRLAMYSLLLSWLPIIGLPMAIAAVRKISKSKGVLYGKKLAWVSVVINALLLGMMILGITMGVLGSK